MLPDRLARWSVALLRCIQPAESFNASEVPRDTTGAAGRPPPE
jgi:hypothetical protein